MNDLIRGTQESRGDKLTHARAEDLDHHAKVLRLIPNHG
jgi:hypothetical protein